MGRGEADTARQVAIDWDALERALVRRGADSEAFLDTRSGDVVYVTRGWSDDHVFNDPELDEGLAAGRLISIEPLPGATQLGWMQGFVATLDDDWPRDALAAALAGPVPLRDFEEALGRFPPERVRWIACRRSRLAAVLRAWLEANDIEPPAPPDQMEG